MKVLSVDKAVEKNRLYVELRGELYPIRDLTVRERLLKIKEFKEMQQQREQEIEEETGEEASFDDLQDIFKEAVQNALEGVPDEVAETITETEWRALQNAIRQAKDADFPVEVEDREDPKA